MIPLSKSNVYLRRSAFICGWSFELPSVSIVRMPSGIARIASVREANRKPTQAFPWDPASGAD